MIRPVLVRSTQRSAVPLPKERRAPRLWYLPLLLAVLLPLLLWGGINLAVLIIADRDLGPAALAPEPMAPPLPDQALLDAAINLVQTSACLPSGATVMTQPWLTGADWLAKRSEADEHAYYVAASDSMTNKLLGIWQVEGGQVVRLEDTYCFALPTGAPARLAEAAILFSSSYSSP